MKCLEECVEIHFVEHPLHIGQPDLKGRMDVPAAVGNVQLLREGFGDQALAVEAGELQLLKEFPTVELPGAVAGAVFLNGDHKLPVGG